MDITQSKIVARALTVDENVIFQGALERANMESIPEIVRSLNTIAGVIQPSKILDAPDMEKIVNIALHSVCHFNEHVLYSALRLIDVLYVYYKESLGWDTVCEIATAIIANQKIRGPLDCILSEFSHSILLEVLEASKT